MCNDDLASSWDVLHVVEASLARTDFGLFAADEALLASRT